MIKKGVWQIGVILVLVIFLTACGEEEIKEKKINSSISKFFVQDTGEDYQLILGFKDETKEITPRGKLTINITDTLNKEGLYGQELFIAEEDFSKQTIKLANDTFDAVIVYIPKAEVKTAAAKKGELKVTFISNLTGRLSRSKEIALPTMSDEELEQVNEEKYQEERFAAQQMVDADIWQIELAGFGYFEPKVKDGKKEKHYRLDLKITNTGEKDKSFAPGSWMITTGTKNYKLRSPKEKPAGLLSYSKPIKAGESREGFLLFEPLPEETAEAKLTFKLGKETVEINLPLVGEINTKVEADIEVISDCGDMDCFKEKFSLCESATVTSKLMDNIVYYYEIIGLKDGFCEVKSKFTANLNPEWVGKTMTCMYDNTKDFEIAIQDMSKCQGPLYNLIIEG